MVVGGGEGGTLNRGFTVIYKKTKGPSSPGTCIGKTKTFKLKKSIMNVRINDACRSSVENSTFGYLYYNPLSTVIPYPTCS